MLNRLVPNSPSAAAATSGLAGNDAHNTGPQDQSSPQHINLLQNLKSAAKEICSPIREQYVAALKKLADSFQQAGDFANLTIVRTEIEEIQRLDGLSKAFGERRFTGDI